MLKESICKLTIFWNSAHKNIPDRRQCVHSRKSKKIWHKSLHSYIVHIFLSGSWFLSSVVVSSLCTFLPAMLVYSVHSAASFQPSVLLFCSLCSFKLVSILQFCDFISSICFACYSVLPCCNLWGRFNPKTTGKLLASSWNNDVAVSSTVVHHIH